MQTVKRIISTALWDDDLVTEKFSPEDKYFMLYLLSNPYTSQLGIYHISVKKVALDMGYSEETILALLKRFEDDYNLIVFSKETNEIAIKNYLRHSIMKGGKPVFDCLVKDAMGIRNKALLGIVYDHLIKYADDPTFNGTVKQFLGEIAKYSNSDFEEVPAEVPATETYTSWKDVDLEKCFQYTFNAYPKHGNMVSSRLAYFDLFMNIPDTSDRWKGLAKDIHEAIELYKADYLETHDGDKAFKYVPNFAKFIQEDLPYWAQKVGQKNDTE